MKISVVIPTHKRPELLLRCLAAISKQNLAHTDFEVIVVSDGPDHEIEQYLVKWKYINKLNLRFLHTSEKKGPAAARNMGWLMARARLVAFTDDDCIPDQHWLRTIDSSYKQQPYIAFTGKTIVPLEGVPTDFASNTAQLQHAEFITANCACTKAALILAGGFDERFKLAWREDSDLQFKLLLHHVPIVHLHDAVIVHPVRAARWGLSIKEQKKGIYDALLFKKYPQLYRSKVDTGILWQYYFTIVLWASLPIFYGLHFFTVLWIAAALLFFMITLFLYKRLRHTTKSVSHITEMLITSIAIPFFSVYWRLYGAIKFRVFFI